MYSIHIVQVSQLSIYANQLFNKYKYDFNFTAYEREEFHDYIIGNALAEYLQLYYKAKVVGVSYYDMYNIVYKTERQNIEMIIRHIVNTNKLEFLRGEVCKLLILGETCIIGRHSFERFIN